MEGGGEQNEIRGLNAERERLDEIRDLTTPSIPLVTISWNKFVTALRRRMHPNHAFCHFKKAICKLYRQCMRTTFSFR